MNMRHYVCNYHYWHILNENTQYSLLYNFQTSMSTPVFFLNAQIFLFYRVVEVSFSGLICTIFMLFSSGDLDYGYIEENQ